MRFQQKINLFAKNFQCHNQLELIQQINYDDSTSIPKRNDKFQGKDLYTTAIGDRVNEALIERNIKFEGGTNISINDLYISNTGADGTVKNVYVTDGSCMTSSGNANPSLTYMALTARAVKHAIQELNKKNL